MASKAIIDMNKKKKSSLGSEPPAARFVGKNAAIWTIADNVSTPTFMTLMN
jgi:hypothetical protein